MSDSDDKTAMKLASEQGKARLALDVIRFVNRSDGAGEHTLYTLAVNHLIECFGGDPPNPDED